MDQDLPLNNILSSLSSNVQESVLSLLHSVISLANLGVSRFEFLRTISNMFINFTKCDFLEFQLEDRDIKYCWKAKRDSGLAFDFDILEINNCSQDIETDVECLSIEKIISIIKAKNFDTSLDFFTETGTFWSGNTERILELPIDNNRSYSGKIGGVHKSVAIVTFTIDPENSGILILKSNRLDFFSKKDIYIIEVVTQSLGLAISIRRNQYAFRERIKEITCLYGISQIVQKIDIELEEILQKVVEILPPAVKYPDLASARIIFDSLSYTTENFKESPYRLSTDLIISNEKRGEIEIVYAKKLDEFELNIFLKEEEKLLETISRQLALIIEREQVKREHAKLEEQLRHADRLATIGQLAAGVAHELNEPLANILGYAQLIQKNQDLPDVTISDLEKIVNASLHAREVVKKLLIFSRQVPTKKEWINFNKVIEDGLYFLESRCKKEGIELIQTLDPKISGIVLDKSQLNQILVNLVVNAIQAMPDGGKLEVKTIIRNNFVSFIVEDTGYGMSEEVKKQIFIPFFTTKEIDQGTGLGLSVVHGIVTSHGGTIEFESEPERGSRFEIKFPMHKHQDSTEIISNE